MDDAMPNDTSATQEVVDDSNEETGQDTVVVVPTTPKAYDYNAAGKDDWQVVDATTGEVIPAVIRADTVAGTLSRFKAADGAIVRENDRFVIVDEARAVRIEPVDAA